MGARDDFLDGELIYSQAFEAGLMPDPDLKVSEWAEQHRQLPQKASPEPGPWRNDRTPYLVEIMDCLSPDSPTEEVAFMKGTQVGGTESGNNWFGYVVHHSPGPMMIVQPTLNLAKRFSKQRVAAMIDEMPILQERIKDSRSRDSGNTTLMKDFTGGVLVIAGANSAADLRSMPCKYLFFDEVDAYPHDLDGEGDPIDLAEKRATNFARRKNLKVSTPTTKGFSRIESSYDVGTREHYHVACPHCGEYQWFKWAGIKWDKADDGAHLPDTAHYVCEHNGCVIHEHHKTVMLAGGKWIADNPAAGPRRRSFHLSALYSPLGWASWASIVERYLKAKNALAAGDDTKMKVFVNTDLAETWEEQGDQVQTSDLQARAEPYRLRTVPMAALLLTAGVDVQGNRLEVKVKAWGPGEESWTVDWVTLYGDPAEDGVWNQLDAYLARPLSHQSGSAMSISATAIDSGGHHTHRVYTYCRNRAYRNVIAVKGMSQAGKPIIGKPTDVEVNHHGVKIKKGVKLWPVGTDTAKALIYGRMRLLQAGPGYMHHSVDLPADYYDQLTAERLVTRYSKGHALMSWVKPNGKRNEALDCEVYALAAAYYLGVQRYKEQDWAKLLNRVNPAVRDMFAPQPEPAPVDGEGVQTSAQASQAEKQSAPAPVQPIADSTTTAFGMPAAPRRRVRSRGIT